jgi:hypothetical protein
MDSFNRSFNFMKIMFVLVFIIIIGGVMFKFFMIADAKSNNKTIYQIEVNSFNDIESYTTTEYDRDGKTGCIQFKDEFGVKHIVCNNYTITEY